MDARGFVTPTAPLTETPSHDLSTERGRLLYLRDVTVPGMDPEKTDLDNFCGTVCCVYGWAAKDPAFNALGLLPFDELPGVQAPRDVALPLFNLNIMEWAHITHASRYGGNRNPTHAELRAHIDDVLEGRVR